MNGLPFYALFNSILVISGRQKGDNEMLLIKFVKTPPPAEIEPGLVAYYFVGIGSGQSSEVYQNGCTSMFYCHFTKGSNFCCNFLFVSLDAVELSK